MYKSASRNLQHAAISAPTLKLVGGDQNLTDKEKYESLKQAYTRLIEINNAEVDKKKKKIYGKQLQDLTHELGAMRDKVRNANPPLQTYDYIIQIFRERCTTEEWAEVKAEAKRRALK
jgi:alpha-beta hydrolase superfamily lysophospholipase